MFYFDEINGKKILKSDQLEVVGLTHFFTTRDSVICSNEPEMQSIVDENRSRVCQFLNISENNLISPNQTHTSNVQIAEIGKNEYPETDTLVLANREQAVFLNFADCTPVILYDSDNRVAAVVHAG